MSSDSDNTIPGHARGRIWHDLYPPYFNDRNYNLHSTPLNTLRGANNPWWRMNESRTRERLLLAGLSFEPPSPAEIIVIDNGIRTEISQGFTPQSNSQAPIFAWAENSSRLTQDQQKKALEKLKKVTYNPTPKKMASRLCLYYRDQARNIINQMEKEKEEEGKRCAVCLEDFEPKDLVMLTPCNHMFHEECIVPWVKSQGQCPVCREVLSKGTGGTVGSSNANNIADALTDSLPAEEIFSILRALEEASNIRRNTSS